MLGSAIHRIKLTLFVVALGWTQSVAAQVISNPNQIAGTVGITNTNPVILAVLVGEGMGSVQVRGVSLTPPLVASTTAAVSPPGSSIPYTLTVQSGIPGIDYQLTALGFLESGRDRYNFLDTTSGPVTPEPAPDIQRDFLECAGMFHIRFEESGAGPVGVDGVFVQADIQFGASQASAQNNPPGTSVEDILVRGGLTYNLTINFNRTTGSDPFLDLLIEKFRCEDSRDANGNPLSLSGLSIACDEVREVVCVIPALTSPPPLGSIAGVVDLLNEAENPIPAQQFFMPHFTLVTAESGPQGNFRLATLETVTPSSGPFTLPNMLPSNTVTPAVGYRVFAEMSIRQGQRIGYFHSPTLGGLTNPTVIVAANTVTNLGDALIMDPGYIVGDILLVGPPEGAASCLADLSRGTDPAELDVNGLPTDPQLRFHSYLDSAGRNILAANATRTASGGVSRVVFPGSFNGIDRFIGDYEIPVAGLHSESSVWARPSFQLRLKDESPTAYVNNYLYIVNQLPSTELTIDPGTNTVVNQHYCHSRINLGFRTTSGTFYFPEVQGSGAYAGSDFELNPADYALTSVQGFGTPTDIADAASTGEVVLCLPQGTYTLRPRVRSVSQGGGSSVTDLNPIDITVGCREIITLTPDLQISLNSHPLCHDQSQLTVAGVVNSEVNVTEISYSLNGATPVVLCTNCGIDPPFSFDVILDDCANQIEVTSTDSAGNEASINTTVTHDLVEPVINCPAPLLLGCDDITGYDQAALSAWLASVTITDNCGPIVNSNNATSVLPAMGCGSGAPIDVTFTANDACQQVSCVGSVTLTQVVVEASCSPVSVCAAAGSCAAAVTCAAIGGCTPVVPPTCDPAGPYSIGTRDVITTCSIAGIDDTATCSVSVLDCEDPTCVAPADLDRECSTFGGMPSTNPAISSWLISATTTDLCSTTGITVTSPVPALFPSGCVGAAGTTTITWTATDAANNSLTCQSTARIVDTLAPTLSARPANATLTCSTQLAPPPVITASDICDSSVPVVATNSGLIGNSCNGTVTRTWTATDDCGNADSHTQTITVRDDVDPMFTSALPGNLTIACSTALPAPATVTASDNCDTQVAVAVVTSPLVGSQCNGTITRTWTATDDCGNDITHTQTITVVDNIDPVFTSILPGNITIGCSTALPAPAAVTASDNCDTQVAVTVVTSPLVGDDCNGAVTRTWTATDDCGNDITHTQTITVVDNIDPVFTSTLPGNIAIACSTALPTPAAVTASDNCDAQVDVTVVTSPLVGDDCNGAVTRTWTATDDCGNDVTHTQTITVHDDVAPTLSAQPGDVTVDCDAIPDPTTITAGDNCDPSVAVMLSDSGLVGGLCGGMITRIWTATDDCGNVTTHTQVITVVDSTDPIATALLDPAAPVAASSASVVSSCRPAATAQFVVRCSATDNCDATPDVSAKVVVTSTEVATAGNCVPHTEEVDVACGETIIVELQAPACADRPASPGNAVSVNSSGVKIIHGESVVLEVTATDDCGNADTVSYDPSVEPSPLCLEVLPDGTCCPAIGSPEPPSGCHEVCPTPAPLQRPTPEVRRTNTAERQR